VQKLAQAFADAAGVPTYVVATRTERTLKHQALRAEAEAVCLWIEEHPCEEIIVAGHSEGGKKAIEVAAHFAQTPTSTALTGILLLDAVGLIDRPSMKLAWNFFWDSLVLTPLALLKQKDARSNFRRYFQASYDITRGALRKTPLKIVHELQEMATASRYLAEVRVPVVLVQGAYDLVSAPRKTGDLQHVFPNSPSVNKVVAQKLGCHSLPLYRSRSVARSCLYLLARSDRQQAERFFPRKTLEEAAERDEQEAARAQADVSAIGTGLPAWRDRRCLSTGFS